MHSPTIALAAVVIGLLMGCRAPAPATVVERPQPPTEKINTHWVNPGDTLYAIAWRYNLNVVELAQANGLSLRSPLQVGDLLRIDVNAALRERQHRSRVIDRRATSTPSRVAKQNTTQTRQQLAAPKHWRWPLTGKVLKGYSYAGRQGHKGLIIDGRQGDPVYAAYTGKVVYAGSGLPAYGNLLILEHGGQYLSAYAHNSRLLVSEGDRVSAGEKIAEVGQTGTTFDHLYFEIRKHGKPVNPLALLPLKAVASNTTGIKAVKEFVEEAGFKEIGFEGRSVKGTVSSITSKS